MLAGFLHLWIKEEKKNKAITAKFLSIFHRGRRQEKTKGRRRPWERALRRVLELVKVSGVALRATYFLPFDTKIA